METKPRPLDYLDISMDISMDIFIEKGSEKVRFLKMGRPGRGDYTPTKGL